MRRGKAFDEEQSTKLQEWCKKMSEWVCWWVCESVLEGQWGEKILERVWGVFTERERENWKIKEKGAYGSFILGPPRPGAVTPVGSAMVPSLSFFFSSSFAFGR